MTEMRCKKRPSPATSGIAVDLRNGMISTLIYLWMWNVSAPFWAWATVSAFLGLGFTFFSGAVQAWLVDALRTIDARLRTAASTGHPQTNHALPVNAPAPGFSL